ncbi:magnesium transporter CorA family protein [Derxia lacustris]|uniref:magnesium transporter CorA family protein n=1 Tax=Derxia lacustris TaxID=764842 RepID=UPI000A17777D|nr:magnesium transporter CorA family protein [Derxia lacustris]
MDAFHFHPDQVIRLATPPVAPPHTGWLWLDITHEELIGDQSEPGSAEAQACLAAGRERLRDAVFAVTAKRLHDLHLIDATNLQHPSYFEATLDYDMVIFRKLTHAGAPPLAERQSLRELTAEERRERRVLQPIVTRPAVFFVFDRVLVTVRGTDSRTFDVARQRIESHQPRQACEPSVNGNGNGGGEKYRLPPRPEELMLRLLNLMVDRYLELRQPLTDQLDRWQRELLDPRRSFTNWMALLDARNEIRKLENLCEEQVDALQELRDSYLENTPDPQRSDGYLVRMGDIAEHVGRVLAHTRRLEASLETAVQLHFAAMSHRTNQIVQTLTIITAIFAPLTLITGVFGMNFETMPLLKDSWGFDATIGAMAVIAVLLLAYFQTRRLIALRLSRSRRR